MVRVYCTGGVRRTRDPTPGAQLSTIRRSVAALAGNGIEARRWYCPPLHQHPAFRDLERAGGLGVSETLGTRLVGLPFHGFLTPADIDRIAASLRRIVESCAPGVASRVRRTPPVQ